MGRKILLKIDTTSIFLFQYDDNSILSISILGFCTINI